jgi:hypothetical protein
MYSASTSVHILIELIPLCYGLIEKVIQFQVEHNLSLTSADPRIIA